MQKIFVNKIEILSQVAKLQLISNCIPNSNIFNFLDLHWQPKKEKKKKRL